MGSLYNQSIPILIKQMRNLSHHLTKAVQYAEQQNVKQEKMLEWRMLHDLQGPLLYQIQSVLNAAKFLPFRIGALKEDTYFPDDERTFEELLARTATTLQLLESVDEQFMDSLDGSEPVIMRTKGQNFKFANRQAYIANFGMPNFYFHLTTAYFTLRSLGVRLTPMEFHGWGTLEKTDEP